MPGILNLILVLLPIVLVLLVGMGLRRAGILDAAGRAAISKLVFWCCLPALLLYKLSERDPLSLLQGPALAIGAATFGIGFVLAYVATLRLPAPERGSIISGTCRFNGAFVGLPIVILLVAAMPEGPDTDRILPVYLVLMACLAPITATMGIIGILLPKHGLNKQGMRDLGIQLLQNPLLWSCGVALSMGSIKPGLLQDTAVGSALDILGQGAVPLALLAVGAGLDLAMLRSRFALLSITCLFRMLVIPAIAFGLCWACAVDRPDQIALMILMACPTAASALPVAQALGADERLMAACIVATTLLAPVTMLLWLIVL